MYRNFEEILREREGRGSGSQREKERWG